MATDGKFEYSENKQVAKIRAKYDRVYAQNKKLKDGGIRCLHCGKLKSRDSFYLSSDPQNKAGVVSWCKQCCRQVANRKDETGHYHPPTIESAKKVLEYIDKPFIQSLWNASIGESNNQANGRAKLNVWDSYIKNIQMKQYIGMRWHDSDEFTGVLEDEKIELDRNTEIYESYEKNKKDITRLLGYDPFQKESVDDQPFLYSQLLGMLDSSQDMSQDMMRVSSAITIVRGFLQQAKIDDTITKLMGNVKELANNSATIRSLQDSKQKITKMITDLAAESCLSLNHSKVSTKGTNTWTGKIQKIRELNLRDGEVNGFDINTCRGFQQVQEISDASIMKQLRLDDSEWSDMVADMRKDNQRLRKQRESYKEINRVLLRENLDLKDTLAEKGIDVSDNTVNLKDIYSVFRDDDNGVEFLEKEGDFNESDNSTI